MTKSRIQQIEDDIRAYQTAIEHAEGALEEAEKELSDELDKLYEDSGEGGNIEEYSEYDKD